MNQRALARLLTSLLLVTSAIGHAQDKPTPAQAAGTHGEVQLEIQGQNAGDPFELSARASASLLKLEVVLDPGWHMYGRNTAGGVPVGLEVLSGSSFAAAGALKVDVDADGKITGKATITLPLRRTAKGKILRVNFSFMVSHLDTRY